MSKAQPEYALQVAVCDYLRAAYPKVFFTSDTIAAVKLTIPQQVRNKKIQKPGFKQPDIHILEPSKHAAGLFLELKASSPYKKDGTLKRDDHLEGQAATLHELRKRGYIAKFVWDFEQAREVIDWYLSQ